MGAKLWPAAEWRATMLSRYELGLVARGQRPCAVVSPAARRARSRPWMLEVLAVELQLGVGRNEVLARPFVLPGEMPPAPDVSEPLAATRLLDTLLEGEELALLVDVSRPRTADQPAHVDEAYEAWDMFVEIYQAQNPHLLAMPRSLPYDRSRRAPSFVDSMVCAKSYSP